MKHTTLGCWCHPLGSLKIQDLLDSDDGRLNYLSFYVALCSDSISSKWNGVRLGHVPLDIGAPHFWLLWCWTLGNSVDFNECLRVPESWEVNSEWWRWPPAGAEHLPLLAGRRVMKFLIGQDKAEEVIEIPGTLLFCSLSLARPASFSHSSSLPLSPVQPPSLSLSLSELPSLIHLLSYTYVCVSVYLAYVYL